VITVIYEKICISHGSVATQLRCIGIFSNHCITNFPENVQVKKIKIGQYLAKTRTKMYGLLFWPTRYNNINIYQSINQLIRFYFIQQTSINKYV